MGYARAREPFNFDLQPDTRLHKVFYMTSEKVDLEPLFQTTTGYRIDRHEFTIFLGRRTRRLGAWDERLKLHEDLDGLYTSVLADSEIGGYIVMDEPRVEKLIQPPPKVGDFLVARLRFTVELVRVATP